MGKATATSLYSASDHRSQYSIFPETKEKKKKDLKRVVVLASSEVKCNHISKYWLTVGVL